MVLQMTGAGWLATLMRAERDESDRPTLAETWLLDGPPEPEMLEALKRLAANDAH